MNKSHRLKDCWDQIDEILKTISDSKLDSEIDSAEKLGMIFLLKDISINTAFIADTLDRYLPYLAGVDNDSDNDINRKGD